MPHHVAPYPTHHPISDSLTEKQNGKSIQKKLNKVNACALLGQGDSNTQPTEPNSVALPIALRPNMMVVIVPRPPTRESTITPSPEPHG